MTCNKLRYPLSLLLILALLIPALPVSGTGNGQAGQYIVNEQAPAPADKIDPAVREALAREEYVEVLVKMTGQVNTGRVARDAGRNAPSGYRSRLAVRTAVVEELQTNAAAGQKSIIKYLEQEQINGNVLGFQGYYIVNMLFVKAAPVVVEQIARRSDVKVILPNSEIHMDTPEIEEFGEIVPLAVEWGVSRVNAPAVWDLGFTGQGIVVGIIDTGADWQHEALKTKWRGYNPANPGSPNIDYNWYDATSPKSALPKDAHGHGTHVTGTVLGAAGSNQIGVAPGAQWIAARVFDDDNSSTSRDILEAGQFMLAPTDINGENPRPDLAPDIINNSWGSTKPGQANEWFRPMVRSWRDAGILPVFAAGNEGELGEGTISNPANYPECLAVAAIDSSNNLAYFSSRGPGYLEGIKPEISAPGVGIRSSTPGGSYKIDSGTSMAAPHVSGVAALLLSANPGLDVDDLEQIIIDTAVPLTDSAYPLSPNYGFGYGLVDALAAVNRMCGGFVTGQVLARGIDNESPVIEHVQEVETTYFEYGFPLEAAVSDNVAVNVVKAMVRTTGATEWTELSMYRYHGDHLDGDYWGQVPWDLVEEPGLEYKIVAVDFAGHQAETDTFNVEVKFGLKPGWSEDFAAEPAFWDWDGDWEWGVPVAGPASQYGGRVMATNLGGNYSDDLCSFLWAPPLDLRHACSPYLRLDHRYEIEEDYDSATVLITDDYGENYDIYFWDGDSNGWQTRYIDLNPYKGGTNQVYIVFIFDADVSVTYPGWYIDRVSVVEVDQKTCYYSDFEDGNGEFEALVKTGYPNSWGWGVPTQGPGSAYSGTQLWATRLGGNYYNNSHCAIRGPVVNLDSDGGNFLSFYHWYDLEYSYDKGWAVFFVSETEYYCYPDYYYTGVHDSWDSDTYPLDWLFDKGYSQFRPGFLFESDYSVTKPGWYIDDVHVYSIGCDISVAAAGMTPVKMTINESPVHTKESDPEKKENAEKSGKSRADFYSISLPVHFRQPLQGPEPAVQLNYEPALPLLPVAAVITVLETETGTATDPADGMYRLWHQATGPDEILTLRVSSPGYQSQEVQFPLAVMETRVLDFILEPFTVIAGDLNDDGTVNVGDAIILLRSIVGLVTLTPHQVTAADVNNDGVVNVSDAILILRYIVGLIPELPIPAGA